MQLSQIVLYKKGKQPRILKFNLGKLNVITGISQSGKSVLIEIVDYCLGATACKISEGVVREFVEWYAIVVVFDNNERYFIARRNPSFGTHDTDSSAIIQRIGEQDPMPNVFAIKPNSTASNIIDFLSQKVGIRQNNLLLPATRNSYEVNFSHTIFYCFQPQGIIANKNCLFYRQDEQFIPQAMKDTLPYLLKAVPENQYEIQKQINELTRDLNRLLREEKEDSDIQSAESSRAFALVDESKQIGILDSNVSVETIDLAYQLLQEVVRYDRNQDQLNPLGENSILVDLQQKRVCLKDKMDELESQLVSVKNYVGETLDYEGVLEQQRIRLASIELYTEVENDNKCPLCHHELENSIPSVVAIRDSLRMLSTQLIDTKRETPRIIEYKDSLVKEIEIVRNEIRKVDRSIQAIYKAQECERKKRDLNIQIGKVIGKAILFLESTHVTDNNERAQKIQRIKDKVAELSAQIDNDAVNAALGLIQGRISATLTSWSRNSELDIEYPNAELCFSPQKLTIYVKMGGRMVPMNQTGSGANWLSFHLAALFALHKEFIDSACSVPRFLMLDQPSQVYFPSQQVTDNEYDMDVEAVKKLFSFICRFVDSQEGKMQVIVTEHARLAGYPDYENAIVENWWDGTKLVPQDWIV